MSKKYKRKLVDREFFEILVGCRNRYFQRLWEDCTNPKKIVGIVVRDELYDEVFSTYGKRQKFCSLEVGNLDNVLLRGIAICKAKKSERAHE